MSFAVLLLPHFALQALLRFREDLHGAPVAVVDETAAKGSVLEVSVAAGEAGVRLGMASTQALARCPGLALLARSRPQEQIVQQILLEAAFSLSPWVEETDAGLCTLDLKAARGIVYETWAEDAVERLAALHLEACVGVAPSPDLALLAAHAATRTLVVRDSLAFLSPRKLEELCPTPALLGILQDWGIRDLGALARLSPQEIAQRLGPEAARLRERAAGKSQRLLRWARPAEVYAEFIEFEHEVETLEPLLFILRRFLEQLSRRLESTHRVAAELHLRLPLESGGTHARLFVILSPTTETEVLFRIVHTHLEDLHLEHRPIGLALAIKPALSEGRQLQMFEHPLRDPNRFGETLGRLAALAGSENTGSPIPLGTHRPDRFRLAPPDFGKTKGSLPGDVLRRDDRLGLPLRRYRPPLAARVEEARGMPVRLASDAASGLVSGALGPYRLSGDWWDADAWNCEEWDIEIPAGLYRLSRRGGEWLLEGCYHAHRLH